MAFPCSPRSLRRGDTRPRDRRWHWRDDLSPPGGDTPARASITRLLGLEIDLSGLYARAGADQALAPLAARYRGVKPPRFPTLFECLLNAVANQQLSLEAGLTVLSRLAMAASPDVEGLHPFPAPHDVLRITVPALRQLGFSERKAWAILPLAQAAADGEFDLDRLEPLEDGDVVRALVRHSGVGRWSANYVLLRGLERLTVFPQGDVGALRGLREFLSPRASMKTPRRRWPAGGPTPECCTSICCCED